MPLRDHGRNLLGSPPHVLTLQLHDLECELSGRFHRRAVRPTRLVDESGEPARLVTLEPLVDRLACDAVLLRELDDGILFGQYLQNQLFTNLHDGPPRLRHPCWMPWRSEGPPSRSEPSVTHVLIRNCSRCRDVRPTLNRSGHR